MNNLPLCVDLDGTLIKADMMFDSVALLIKKNPFYLFIIPFWLSRGKLFLKEQLIKNVHQDIDNVPINQDVVDYLIDEKKNGRNIILVTATMQNYADEFKEKFDFFDEAVGSKGGINLVGIQKAEYLKNRFGDRGFDYIGDSSKDLYVWKFAANALIVGNNQEIIDKAKQISNVIKIWEDDNESKISIIYRQLRVYQWVKNLLIFLPALLAHNLELSTYFNLILSFFSFSFVASSIYIFNDLMDLNSDRNHEIKKNRPIAAGKFKISDAFIYSFFLMIVGILISAFVNSSFMIVLIIYIISTFAYSIYLKKIYIIDIITLAVLYTLRLIAGSATSGEIISEWFAAYSLFFFFSMGALKRFTELKNSKKEKLSGRGYLSDDIDLIKSMGISSSLISVLVMVLYINSSTISQLYPNPKFLYLIIPILLHWVLRVWILADRSLMNEDPIVFGIKDKSSYISAILIFVILLLGIL